MKVIHLIKVKMDTSGNVRPINYDHCPLYKSKRIKSNCQEGNRDCVGFRNENVLRENESMTYTIKCNFVKR